MTQQHGRNHGVTDPPPGLWRSFDFENVRQTGREGPSPFWVALQASERGQPALALLALNCAATALLARAHVQRYRAGWRVQGITCNPLGRYLGTYLFNNECRCSSRVQATFLASPTPAGRLSGAWQRTPAVDGSGDGGARSRHVVSRP